MKPIFYLLTCLFMTAVASCDKDDVGFEDAFLFYYDETQCADPWDLYSDRTGDDTAILVRTYLEERGIRVFSVAFDDDSPLNVFCLACDCGTGRRIIVTAKEADVAQLESLMFYR